MAVDSECPPEPEAKEGRGESLIPVEVAYATPARQALLQVTVPAGCTVAEAIERSGICSQFPGISVDPDTVGIFGRKVPLSQVLQVGDRVEIYRPLLADPKETRRRRARKEPPG